MSAGRQLLALPVLTRKAVQLPIRVSKFFLYNYKGLDVISLQVKYYEPWAHSNKVIKL